MSNPHEDKIRQGIAESIPLLEVAAEVCRTNGLTATYEALLDTAKKHRAVLGAYQQWRKEAQDPGDGPDDEWFINKANEEYGSDEIEIDPDAMVSRGDDPGAFVAAWIWVHLDDKEGGGS